MACASVASGGTYAGTLPNATPTKYYFIWDGNGGAECNYTLSLTNIIPLPIDLLYFDASEQEESIQLNWATASERSNDYFTIEKSINGVDWEYLTTIDGVGNSFQTTEYSTTDYNPYNGISYYRLTQTDFDGTTTESGIASASIFVSGISARFIPNPAKSNSQFKMEIYASKNEKTEVSFINSMGKILSVDNIQVTKGVNEFDLDHLLAAGVYFVKIADESGSVYTEKFIVE